MISDAVFQTQMNKLMDRFACKLKAEQITQYWESLKNLETNSFCAAVSSILADDSINRFPIPITIERIANRMNTSDYENSTRSQEYVENRIALLERYRLKFQSVYDAQIARYGNASAHIESKLNWIKNELYNLKPYDE